MIIEGANEELTGSQPWLLWGQAAVSQVGNPRGVAAPERVGLDDACRMLTSRLRYAGPRCCLKNATVRSQASCAFASS